MRSQSNVDSENAILSKSDEIENSLEPNTFKAVQQAKETGASSLLNVIPLEEHNFTLNKTKANSVMPYRLDIAVWTEL